MIEHGEFSEASARARARANDCTLDVTDPTTGEVLARVTLREELPQPWWWEARGNRGSAKTFARMERDARRAARMVR